MDQAEHHQLQLERQEMEFDEYQQKRDLLNGRLLGAVDLLKIAENTQSVERRDAAIADLLFYHNELDKLKKQFWGEK